MDKNKHSQESNNHVIIGVEEAGRGPVIGPLVVAVVWLTKEQEKELELAGVTDSKKLSPKKREELYHLIKLKATHVAIRVIIPQEIDQKMQSGTNLNQIELIAMANLMKLQPSKKAYVDCPSVNKYAVAKQLKEGYDGELIVEHKADQNFVVVGAASIIAKVTRDNCVAELQKTIPFPIGSGYPSDPVTQKFIEEHHHEYPEIFRKSWQTYKDAVIKAKHKQSGLVEYY